jgi:hypothetical protein
MIGGRDEAVRHAAGGCLFVGARDAVSVDTYLQVWLLGLRDRG